MGSSPSLSRSNVVQRLPRALALAALILASLAVLSSGCSTTTVKTRLTLPPRTAAMQTKQKVLVVPFSGRRGPSATRDMRTEISSGRLHTVFDTNLEGQRLAQINETLKAGGAVDAGGLGGATVILAGTVEDDEYENTIDEYKTDKCVKHDKKGKCTDKVKVPVYTLRETCGVRIVARAVAVATGDVLFERTFRGTASAQDTAEKALPPSQRNTICADAYSQAISLLVPFVTPFTVTVALSFHDVEDSGRLTSAAVKQVELGNLAKAHDMFVKVISDPALDDKGRAWAHHNYAVLLWAQARFDDCVKQARMAEEVLGNDSDVQSNKQSCTDYMQ